jgi:hypothetical protein
MRRRMHFRRKCTQVGQQLFRDARAHLRVGNDSTLARQLLDANFAELFWSTRHPNAGTDDPQYELYKKAFDDAIISEDQGEKRAAQSVDDEVSRVDNAIRELNRQQPPASKNH